MYETSAPWSRFGIIVALTDEEMSIENIEIGNQKSSTTSVTPRRQSQEGGIYIVGGKKMVW